MPGRAIRWAYVATVVVFLASLAQYYQRNTGFTTLISFGDQFEKTRLPAVVEVPHFVHYQSPGYDGQFYAQLAVEPLLRNRRLERAMDSPSYRARRMLFSWSAYALGLGRPAWILKAYALQNIVAWLLLAWVLLRWLPPSAPRNAVAWIGCLFGVGLIYSVRFALTEGPGLLLIALAVIAIERGRPWLASGLMALVGLGRETNFIAGGLLVDRVPRRWPDALGVAMRGALMVAPFAAWFAVCPVGLPAARRVGCGELRGAVLGVSLQVGVHPCPAAGVGLVGIVGAVQPGRAREPDGAGGVPAGAEGVGQRVVAGRRALRPPDAPAELFHLGRRPRRNRARGAADERGLQRAGRPQPLVLAARHRGQPHGLPRHPHDQGAGIAALL